MWEGFTPEYDEEIGAFLLSDLDGVLAKMKAITDRREETDIYDLSLVFTEMTDVFKQAVRELAKKGEADELLSRINQALQDNPDLNLTQDEFNTIEEMSQTISKIQNQTELEDP